ncbi:Glycolipid transfer protein domain-containing protein 1-like [Globisporangium polare]
MVEAKQQQQDERLTVSVAPAPPLSNGSSTGATSPPASGGVLASKGSSAPNTPLVSARGVPAMSPSSSAVKRGLRQKMMDELKSVRRKSPPPEKGTPALTPILEPSAMSSMSAGMMPPPLMLNASMVSVNNDDASGHRSSQGEDGGRLSSGQISPADPSVHTKAKGCSICERSFTVFRAKHTCKVCGSRICDDCSKNRVKLNRRLERKKGSRLCDPCARKYVQSSVPLLSPSASPMLVPRKDQLLQRRHSVPSHAFSRTPSGSMSSTSGAKQNGQDTNGASSDPVAQSSAAGKSSLASVAVEKREPHDSHLRSRHWISLAAISAMVVVRILIGSRASSATAAVSFMASPSQFLARGLDSVLSVKILGCYLLGLVVFDEIVRAKNKNSAVVSGAGSAPRRRRRTKSRVVLTVAPASSPHGDQDADDEVLEVDTGDKVVQTGGFSLEKLTVVLEETAVKARTADDELKLATFLSCCESICDFVLVFGRATSFAGSTVGGYITSINTNLTTWPADTAWREQSICAIIEREVELQVASAGGKKKPSCSRCVLRLLWFVEFVEACVKYTLIESADENCSSGASRAYEETIGSRHPWIIRKGVNSALGSIPSRSTILADLHLTNCSPEEVVARLKVGQNYMKAIVAEIHQVMKKHDLLDIK